MAKIGNLPYSGASSHACRISQFMDIFTRMHSLAEDHLGPRPSPQKISRRRQPTLPVYQNPLNLLHHYLSFRLVKEQNPLDLHLHCLPFKPGKEGHCLPVFLEMRGFLQRMEKVAWKARYRHLIMVWPHVLPSLTWTSIARWTLHRSIRLVQDVLTV